MNESIILDLETTGLNPATDRIIEIYAIKIDKNFKQKDYFYSLIKIDRKLPAYITNLTGINEKDLCEKGKEEKYVLKRFKKFIDNDLLVGHNIDKFDILFLKEGFKRFGETINNKTFDTLTVARKTFNFDTYNLEGLAKYLNIKSENFHNAKSDVLVTFELFKKLINAYN